MMEKALFAKISELRRQLENPYALIEFLEADATVSASDRVSSVISPLVALSRRNLEDPYAYLDDEGGFDSPSKAAHELTVVSSVSATKSGRKRATGAKATEVRRWSDRQIEARAREIQAELWRERRRIWNNAPPSDPVEILDPTAALHLLGYAVSAEDGIGHYRRSEGSVEVAGLIDPTRKIVRVSGQFSPAVRLFTTAHELGHAALHPGIRGVHRDRPLDGVGGQSRELMEREADRFATYFLMPQRAVHKRFTQAFGMTAFTLNDHTAFALGERSSEQVRTKYPTRRHFARLLSSLDHYDGRQFPSLAAQFRVSVEAMAIRLEELGLVN